MTVLSLTQRAACDTRLLVWETPGKTNRA